MGFSNPILAGEELLRNAIRSENFSLTEGWRIDRDGSAVFNDLTSRGSMQSPNYVAGISGWKVDSDGTADLNELSARGEMSSPNHVPGTTGWHIEETGSAEFNELEARGSMQSPNFVHNEEGDGQGWQIAADGSAEFNSAEVRGNVDAVSGAFDTLSADASFYYKGEELSSIRTRQPKGLLGWAELAAGTYTSGATAHKPLLELDITVGANRVVRVNTNPIRMFSTVTNDQYRLRLTYTTNGTQPTSASTQAEVVEMQTHQTASRRQSMDIEWTFHTVAVTRLRVLLTFDMVTVTNTATIDATNPIRMYMTDIGYAISSATVGINRYTGAAAKVLKDKTWTVETVRSYRGATATFGGGPGSALSSTLGYQGQYGGSGGNGNSYCLYYFSAASLLEIQDIIGIPSTDIDLIEFYIYMDHWYSSAGGTVSFGLHNNTSKTDDGGVAPGTAYNLANFPWEGRDIGKWLSISPTGSTATRLRNGTFKGFTLGPGPDSTHEYYGYANLTCKMRVVYYK